MINFTFRANPDYELVLYDRLSPSQQDCLRGLLQDDDFYGIIRPKNSTLTGLGIKSICCNTALLYLTLQEAGSLPTYLKNLYQEKIEDLVYQLVIDNILEIEHQGNFVSGVEAIPLLSPRHQVNSEELLGTGKIAKLSLDALKYAQALAIDDSSKLSARLYFYHRLPLTPQLFRLYPSEVVIADYLKIASHQTAGKQLKQNWREATSAQGDDFWRTWKHLNITGALDNQVYKLYISPTFSVVGDIFPTLVEIFTDLQVPQFKVGGKQIAGLLRSDKIIAYFHDFESLKNTANAITSSLPSLPSQGVPFTSELGGDGLLSWGIDPPAQEQRLQWQDRESWRVWLTNRLATGILAAKSANSALEPWQFALYRLKKEGVDPKTWQPINPIN